MYAVDARPQRSRARVLGPVARARSSVACRARRATRSVRHCGPHFHSAARSVYHCEPHFRIPFSQPCTLRATRRTPFPSHHTLRVTHRMFRVMPHMLRVTRRMPSLRRCAESRWPDNTPAETRPAQTQSPQRRSLGPTALLALNRSATSSLSLFVSASLLPLRRFVASPYGHPPTNAF